MMSSLLFLTFPALIAFAACYDCLSMRITNGLCLLVAASFFPVAIAAGLPLPALISHLTCAASMLALGFILFAKGWIGGGDAKLFAAAALWFGWSGIADFVIVVILAGGLLALGVLALRALCLRLAAASGGRISPTAELPYGIALACGALAIYPQQSWAAVLT